MIGVFQDPKVLVISVADKCIFLNISEQILRAILHFLIRYPQCVTSSHNNNFAWRPLDSQANEEKNYTCVSHRMWKIGDQLISTNDAAYVSMRV